MLNVHIEVANPGGVRATATTWGVIIEAGNQNQSIRLDLFGVGTLKAFADQLAKVIRERESKDLPV